MAAADYDLIVRGALVVTLDAVRAADVAVSEGVIAAVGTAEAEAREEIDGTGHDLTLLDLGESWPLEADELLYRHTLSPFVGETVRGRIVRTLVRGRTVYENGRVCGEPGGRLVRRDTTPR